MRKRLAGDADAVLLFLSLVTVIVAHSAVADDTNTSNSVAESTEASQQTLPEGHSNHGEVFNEGPRQAAYLMPGVGSLAFEVQTPSSEAEAFVKQGVAQLHGFWYFESERSFRQAAMHDPDCAIAYWGMAMSNRKNTDRAQGFIQEAMDRKDNASSREQKYIEAFSDYINAKSDSDEEKRKRDENYVAALDDLLIDFSDDLDAKAFLCEFLWSIRKKNKLTSYSSINAMLQDVLDVNPLHSVHHYRIHLWDTKKPERALESAARCGLAAPAIAHMWHMPGHIYSRLKRYHDAVYQQEASARVDHAHMMKDRVLPDQIHNFAHNNEWCIRNLIHIGRVSDAVALAKNMIQLPRHPKYNHIGKSGSYKYGRERLLDVLRTFQMHEEIVALATTPFLEASGDTKADLKRDQYIAAACVVTGHDAAAAEIHDRLEEQLRSEKAKQKDAGDKAEAEAKEKKDDEKAAGKARSTAEGKFRTRIRNIEKALAEIDGRMAVRDERWDAALELFKTAGGVPVEEHLACLVKADRADEAVKKITEHVRSNKNETRPLAAQVELLWSLNRADECQKAFDDLREISSAIDRRIPVFARLDDIAEELGYPKNWTQPTKVADDIGVRPPLDSLGPFRWSPGNAPAWTLTDVDGQSRSLKDFRGQPVVAIFYLGAGCLHCAEQLQKFAPMTQSYADAGVSIIAISTDKPETLSNASKDLEGGMPFPLVSDSELNVFRNYRCYDDFEQQPLHGTFLIDGSGRIRWQDISYEPFMDADFLLQESQRLLEQDRVKSQDTQTTVTAKALQ